MKKNLADGLPNYINVCGSLAQGIPALSHPTGRTDLSYIGISSFDMNTPVFMSSAWPRSGNGNLDNRVLHSDVKNVAFRFVYPVYRKIVEIGGLK